MDILLIFFILPLATIIIAAIMESILNNPVAVAAFVFALAIVIVFIAFTASELIYAIVYTILAYIVAVIICLIRNWCRNNNSDDDSPCHCLNGITLNNDTENATASTTENTINSTINTTNISNSARYGCNRTRRF